MTQSMTAFARHMAQGEWGSLIWEIRSVNHRYLDLSLRIPEKMRSVEAALRETARNFLQRGKVDAILKIQINPSVAGDLQLNHAFAKQVITACEQLQQFGTMTMQLNSLDVLNYPGVVQESSQEDTEINQHIVSAFEQALQALQAARQREGEQLADMIAKRLQCISQQVSLIRERLPVFYQQHQQKLQERLAELQVACEPGRLEQELVFIAQKTDISEELDRIDTHVNEVNRVLSLKKPAGRRLDFLMQELNREANTLGAKSTDVEISQAMVELKVLIDQMREQVQNIE